MEHGSMSGSLRLPPGAVDKSKSINGSYASGAGPEILSYTPAANVDLYIAAFLFTIEAFNNTTRIIMQGNGIPTLQSYITALPIPIWYPPFPWKHEGDGATAFSLRLSQFTGASQRGSGFVWAWEEPKAP